MMGRGRKTADLPGSTGLFRALSDDQVNSTPSGSLALLIDFGSTFTKVTAVDLEAARILGRAQAPSTVDSDVSEGLVRALALLAGTVPAMAARPAGLDGLDALNVRASSSAAGGLRMVVAGLVPGLTVEAANAAALGAGAKVVGAYGFKLDKADIAEITALAPDMILLTGGTEGGDQATISHNAAMFAEAPLSVPMVVAGNTQAAAAIGELLTRAGKEVRCTANVLPAAGTVAPEAAQKEIRHLFMRRITDAKGLDRIKARVPVVLPTPMAVQKAALLGAQGLDGMPGLGALLLVDVGGATTDVYSIGDGKPRGKDMIPAGLPEPFSKRTVEGDLGLRYNARTILGQVGEDFLWAAFTAAFPEFETGREDLLAYVEAVSSETDRVPSADWQFAADAVMARIAVDLAIARHVGRSEPYYAGGGAVELVTGKDMTETPTLIGTGGIFTYNRFAERILLAPSRDGATQQILRPLNPRIQIDEDYVLHAVGLLAESHPEVALRIFQDHFPAIPPDGDHAHGHQHLSMARATVGDDPCCS
jgi:uncharacterized protein (TIGR01319 family)